MIRHTTAKLAALFIAATFGLAACDVPSSTQTFSQSNPKGLVVAPRGENVGFTVAPPNAPSGAAVDNFARAFLDGLQARSFAERREFCGYFFIDSDGNLQGTPPRRGTVASCDMPAPQVGQGIIASYHTHGAYGPAFDNEVPSTIDLTSDFDYGIDGYVSTPGGRVWLVDFQTLQTRQICGLSCVRADPGFVPKGESSIRTSYTVPELRRRNLPF